MTSRAKLYASGAVIVLSLIAAIVIPPQSLAPYRLLGLAIGFFAIWHCSMTWGKTGRTRLICKVMLLLACVLVTGVLISLKASCWAISAQGTVALLVGCVLGPTVGRNVLDEVISWL